MYFFILCIKWKLHGEFANSDAEYVWHRCLLLVSYKLPFPYSENSRETGIFSLAAMFSKVSQEIFVHCPLRYLLIWRGDLSMASASSSTLICFSLHNLHKFSAKMYCIEITSFTKFPKLRK